MGKGIWKTIDRAREEAGKATALRCLALCRNEKLSGESTHPSDEAYQHAVIDCIRAIAKEFGLELQKDELRY